MLTFFELNRAVYRGLISTLARKNYLPLKFIGLRPEEKTVKHDSKKAIFLDQTKGSGLFKQLAQKVNYGLNRHQPTVLFFSHNMDNQVFTLAISANC